MKESANVGYLSPKFYLYDFNREGKKIKNKGNKIQETFRNKDSENILKMEIIFMAQCTESDMHLKGLEIVG